MDIKNKKAIYSISIILILIFALLLRVNSPESDLPDDITFSGSILTDEGNQCHNSRSKFLYNNWYPDDWRITLYNPVLPFLKLGIFKIFGVGLWQIRAVSYIFSLLSIIFFFLTLKSYFNKKYAIFGTILLSINFLMVMFSKIGTFEIPMIFWMILSLYFVEKYSSTKKNIFLIFSGISAFTAFIFKNIAIYFIPVPITALLVYSILNKENINKKKIIKPLIYLISGVGFIFLIWYLLFYSPNKEWINSAPGRYMKGLMSPKSLSDILKNFISFPWKEQFHKIAFVWVGSLLFIPVFYRKLLKQKVQLLEISYFLYFMAHTSLFLFLSYRPTRYLIPVIPAMIFMSVALAHHILNKKKRETFNFINKSILFVLDNIWLVMASFFCFIPLFSIYIIDIKTSFSLFFLLLCFFSVIIFFLFKEYLNRKKIVFKINKHYKLLKVSLLTLFIIALVLNLFYYLKWDKYKTSKIKDISHELKVKLDNAYIGGLTAPAVVLNNTHQSLFLYPNFVNFEKTFEKYNLTHALLGTGRSREVSIYYEKWPQKMKNSVLKNVYNLKDYFLHLYSYIDPYITSVQTNNQNEFEITINNPDKINKKINLKALSPIFESYLNMIRIKDLKKSDISYNILKPGKNKILVPINSDLNRDKKILFYIDNSKFKEIFRYEAESFYTKSGKNILSKKYSNYNYRFYNAKDNKSAYFAFSHPLYYSPGIINAKFKLIHKKIRSNFKKTSTIDIYSHKLNKITAYKEIRKININNNKKGNYFSLISPVFKTDKIEYRVKGFKNGNIEFDFVDVEYIQGYFFNWKKNNGHKK